MSFNELLQAIGPIGIFAYLVITKLLDSANKKKEVHPYVNGKGCAYNAELSSAQWAQLTQAINNLADASQDQRIVLERLVARIEGR